jgi:hypothetical protein
MVHALDRKTGKSLWTFTTGARVDFSPVVSGGRAYVGSNDGNLHVLDVMSDKSVFQFEAGGALCVAVARLGPAGDWIAGRQTFLPGVTRGHGVCGVLIANTEVLSCARLDVTLDRECARSSPARTTR